MAADPCSFANVAELFTTHLHLDWKADFAQSKLIGSVTLDLTVTVDDITTVTLDSRGLTISSVALDGASCAFEVKPETALGSAVVITTPALKKGQNVKLVVQYETSSDSAGIQWLEPSQTQDKKHPYLFTQFQAIHARSAIPCQDSPSVKTKYSATVTVPKELTALMSALSTGSTESGDSKTYTFDQPVPIPTYLIALAIGDLYSRDIGPRTRVWAEASVVEKAAWEFEETEQYLVTAEQLLTPYEWGRYDVLCLPGSFPYGGMENPCLTFVTPTLLAGDRSLTHVVAHEITHSWTGNLVTNHTWQSFWLNEGFTVFVERKIIQRMFGAPSQHLGYINGWTALLDCVEHFGRDHEFTTLDPKLDGIDPDDAFSSVPYERGANFLFFLERTVGGDAVFEPFLKEWINQNKFKTVTTEGFIKFFHDHFDPIVPKEKLAEIDWDAWLHQRGMPPVDMTQFYDQVLRERSVALADRWIKGDLEGFSSSDIEDFNTPQVVAFVERIMLEKPAGLPASTLEKIDSLYHFSEKKNSEIRAVWYTLALISNYEAVFPGVEEFLTEQGRMKFVRPLYRRLYSCEPNGKAKAVELFEKNKNIYHNIAKKMVQQDLIRLGASFSN